MLSTNLRINPHHLNNKCTTIFTGELILSLHAVLKLFWSPQLAYGTINRRAVLDVA